MSAISNAEQADISERPAFIVAIVLLYSIVGLSDKGGGGGTLEEEEDRLLPPNEGRCDEAEDLGISIPGEAEGGWNTGIPLNFVGGRTSPLDRSMNSS